ncbi:ABC transporter substrate-binding protein [Pseudoalteromonas sp. MMG012]|uniref:substrate-binding periplasmic protein n=1 Tax=Pseudoalteromonas sp. MMG012 TaxID=2822686 RepID=UPI001B39F605|nr:transporter substrate-binding domain-containing protein [Pseudoalteromonas sp. MMG012]MBQ4851688.1 transporter substrate-binding domain-containing protein [Pseudoalteromonas sp. MMG012]
MRILFSIFLFISSNVHSEPYARQINITTGQWPPYIDQSKEDQGCVASLIRDAFALYDIKTRFVFMPWERAYKDGMKKEFIGSAYWYFSKQRSEDYIYTKHAITEEVSRFYHLSSLPLKLTRYSDLKPYTLLLNKGLTYPDELLEAISEHNIRTVESTYTDKNIPFLLRKRADIMIMNENTAQEYKRSLPVSKRSAITSQKKPAYIKRGFLLINKTHQQYAILFDQALNTLWSNKDYIKHYEQNCSKIGILTHALE